MKRPSFYILKSSIIRIVPILSDRDAHFQCTASRRKRGVKFNRFWDRDQKWFHVCYISSFLFFSSLIWPKKTYGAIIFPHLCLSSFLWKDANFLPPLFLSTIKLYLRLDHASGQRDGHDLVDRHADMRALTSDLWPAININSVTAITNYVTPVRST